MGDGSGEAVVGRVLDGLSAAWNAGDGQAFGEPFADDADYVTVRGEQHVGREAIARGHQGIFDTIYKGSIQAYGAPKIREVGDDVIVVHVRSDLTAPTGPLAGEHSSAGSLVLTRRDGAWRIVSYRNTLIAPPR